MKLKLKRGPARSGDGGSLAERRGGTSAAAAEFIPAPAGTLHRALVGGYAPAAEEGPIPAAAVERSAVRLRAARDLLRSRGGRVIIGSLLFFCIGAAAATAFGMRRWLMHDERFVVPSSDDVTVTGNTHITRDQVLSVFGADVERNIFKVPLAERRADLERLPWVEHATVMRLLPDKLRVALVERTPIAFVRQGSTIGLVDAAGVLLDMPESLAGEPGYSFPVLTGLKAADSPSDRAARMDVYKRFVADLSAGPDKLIDKVSEVDVSNPEDLRAVVTGSGDGIVVHFGDERFLPRFQSYLAHVAEWRHSYPQLGSADMRYDHQVVLEMKQGQGQGQGTAVGTAMAAGSSPVAGASPTAGSSPVAALPPAAGVAGTNATGTKATAVIVLKTARTAGAVHAPAVASHLHAASHLHEADRVKNTGRLHDTSHVHETSAKQSAANRKLFAALAAAHSKSASAVAANNGSGAAHP